jgi:hypothetical protein
MHQHHSSLSPQLFALSVIASKCTRPVHAPAIQSVKPPSLHLARGLLATRTSATFNIFPSLSIGIFPYSRPRTDLRFSSHQPHPDRPALGERLGIPPSLTTSHTYPYRPQSKHRMTYHPSCKLLPLFLPPTSVEFCARFSSFSRTKVTSNIQPRDRPRYRLRCTRKPSCT